MRIDDECAVVTWHIVCKRVWLFGTQENSSIKINILNQESRSTHQDESNGVVFSFIASIFRYVVGSLTQNQ